MLYQRKTLPNTNVGAPGPLPGDLKGLADESLADLSRALDPAAARALGYENQGFFPVAPTPPPPPKRDIEPLAFMQRLTPQERIAIRAAAKTDQSVEDYLDLLDKADTIDLDHADTINGVNFLVFKNLLTAARAAAVRA